jgi:SAM-dependent methyltransferase
VAAPDPRWYHRLEFETTLHFLKKHFPKRGLILDAGGGPGRYTVTLASQGYDVLMLDVTPANVKFAKRQIIRAGVQQCVKDVIEGTIVDLSRFADNSFDGVICLGGPLSHVVDKRKRDKAVRELVRVAKPGAPIAASVMSRFSVLVVELTMFPEEVEMAHYQKLLHTGDYLGQYGFTACHFFLPEDFARRSTIKASRWSRWSGWKGLAQPPEGTESHFEERKAVENLACHAPQDLHTSGGSGHQRAYADRGKEAIGLDRLGSALSVG